MNLLSLVEGRSIAVVLGDGGVGKTTVAAALAALAAASGRHVLAVTVDPSNRLKDALGLEGLPGVEEPVPLDAFGGGTGTLHAMVLDSAAELDRVIARAVPTEEARRRITGNVFYRKAAASMTGTHEYMAMERIHEAHESGRYDLVILDTPPERHALDFLDAPRRLDELLGSDTFRLFVSASAGLSRVGLEAIRFRKLVLRGIGKFAGEETFLALLDFVLAFSPTFDGFRERAARVRGWLSGDGCAALLVCRPGVRCAESVRLPFDALARRGITPAALVVNRVHEWPPPGTGPFVAGDVDAGAMKDALLSEPAIGLHSRSELADLADATLALAATYRAGAEADAAVVSTLRSVAGGTPVYVIPLLREEVRDLAGLARLARVVREATPVSP
jgi:anion-transporting  ArsA/GET3 family ATPase